MEQKFSTKDLVLIGVMAALIFAANFLSFPIPMGGLNTRLHLGNVVMLIAGFLLGGMKGGLAAGIGSGLFDLVNPIYFTSAPTTIIFRFIMIFICGKISHSNDKKGMHIPTNIFAADLACLAYVIMYMGRSLVSNMLLGMAFQPALFEMFKKGGISLINAVIGIVIAVPVGLVVNKAVSSTLRNNK